VCGGGGGVTLMPVDCAPAMVGVDAAFAGAIMGNCGCHGGGGGRPDLQRRGQLQGRDRQRRRDQPPT
jgi:hypothetical protein